MNKFTKKWLLGVMLIAMLICSNQIFAQSIVDLKDQISLDKPKAFFTKVNASNQLRASNFRFQRLNNSEKSRRVDIVRLPENIYNLTNLSFYVDELSELINFQNFGTKLIVEKTSLEVLSEKEVAWIGKVFKSVTKEEVGNVTLIIDDNENITGSVDLEGNFYEIRPLGNAGLHALQTVDNRYLKEKRPDDFTVTKKDSSEKSARKYLQPVLEASALSALRCSPEYQRLLVVYTANATQGRDIDGIISLAIQETN